MPEEAFSLGSCMLQATPSTCRSFLSNPPTSLCPLQQADPPRPSSLCLNGVFPSIAPGSYYIQPHFFLCFSFWFSHFQNESTCHSLRLLLPFALPPTLQALREQSLRYCKALSHDSFKERHSALCIREASLHSSVRACFWKRQRAIKMHMFSSWWHSSGPDHQNHWKPALPI